MDSSRPKRYFVYIVRCSDDTFYSGITTDIERRMDEHNNSLKGAKYTRQRRPVVLLYQDECENRSEASKLEHFIKKLTKEEKKALINKPCKDSQ